MNVEQLKSYQHNKEVIKAWLDAHLPADKAGTGWICPFCGNGEGKGQGEGLILHQAKNSPGDYLIHCFSRCSRSWDLIGFIAQLNGLTTQGKDFIEACKLTAQQLGIPLEIEQVKELGWDDEIQINEKPGSENKTFKNVIDNTLQALDGKEGMVNKTASQDVNVYTFEDAGSAKQPFRDDEIIRISLEEDGSKTYTLTDGRKYRKMQDGRYLITHPQKQEEKREGLTQEQIQELENTITKAQEQALNSPRFKEYIKKRGISIETAQKYGLGYVEKRKFKEKKTKEEYISDGILYPKDSHTYGIRAIEKKGHRKPQGIADSSFNLQTYIDNPNEEPIFIVEGFMDALSILDNGYQAIALDGTAHTIAVNRIIENELKNPFLLMLDDDEAGHGSRDKTYQALKEAGLEVYQTNVLTQKEGVKDANEYLLADKAGFIEALKENNENYKDLDPEYRKAKEEYLQGFNKNKAGRFLNGIAESVNNPPIPTGFSILDHYLDGGLYEGLYIIGGISSLGKTAITLQIADQIAGSGNDVIFFSLEMSENELMARSISRNTSIFGRDNGIDPRNFKTVRGITNKLRYENYNNQELELITDAMEGYFKSTGETLRILEAQGKVTAQDVRGEVDKHVEFTGNKPVVFIDYLQLMGQPGDVKRNLTEKQTVDENVMALKQICRDYKIPIFAISSFNRDNYYKPVSMEAFKESGAIEYSSDVLFGIERQGQGSFTEKSGKDLIDYLPAVKKYEKKNKERYIHLKILKNRNGASDVSVNFNYQFMFNDFLEGEIAPYLNEDFKLDKSLLKDLID